jgi:hypothetical protein
MRYVITEIEAAKTVPQVKSTTVTNNGHPFIVARFVKSYVAYVIRPNNAPKRIA